MYIEKYFEFVIDNVKKIYETQTENIKKSADIITNCILNKGSVYVFGATHAGILSEELFYRAGGLMLINPIFPP
ncbi:MAG: SIS domain-containing protein, partial [Actinobacteria bacterium]|nr:SIS domain-containing protein [Actinomycetota bacterium]